jgi:toluene monooxygenase system protein E
MVLKPAIDEAIMHQFGQEARTAGDLLTGMLLDAQYVDSERSRRFATGLMKFLCESDKYENRKTINEWLRKWNPLGDRAIDAFCTVLEDGETAAETAKAKVREFQQNAGLG